MRKARGLLLLGCILVAAGAWMALLNGANLTSLPIAAGILGNIDSELKPGEYFTVVDENRRVIDRLGRDVTPGDELITPDGNHYRVEKLSGKIAQTKLLGIDRDILAWEEFFNRATVPVGIFGPNKREIGIYHSHTDESFVPTEGTSAIPYRGGILKVGTAMSSRLRAIGVDVAHELTPHDPHDALAYVRSRKTAARLLRSNPIALFDVHRDGIPDPDFYRNTVSGASVGQIRVVIGRQNPKMGSNLDLAKRLTTYANRVHPGLVKGIFLGKGSFNQDLSPTALLLECGTHTLTRPEVERGVAMLADAVPVVLGLTKPQPGVPIATTAKTPGAWGAFLWILAVTVVGVAGFLLVSAGSVAAAWGRLQGFWRHEMNVGGSRKREGDGS